jgi:CxxC motif-containing protein
VKEFVCIVCPKGCRLRVDEESGKVSGNSCGRGEEYGRNEAMNPVRFICSTVRIEGAQYRRCPVKTEKPIPKARIFDAMKTLEDVRLKSPVAVGDIAARDVCGLGIDFVVTRAM